MYGEQEEQPIAIAFRDSRRHGQQVGGEILEELVFEVLTFKKCGFIRESNFGNLHKIGFKRGSRTDKGVGGKDRDLILIGS